MSTNGRAFHDDMTLEEARELLRTRLDDGADCPCCAQRVQLYKFAINGAMVVALARMYRAGGKDWVDVPKLGLPGGHFAKMRFWELIERYEATRADGSRRVGIWRVTDAGEVFLLRRRTIPRRAKLYNNRCFGFVPDEEVSVDDVIGTEFNYAELMAGV